MGFIVLFVLMPKQVLAVVVRVWAFMAIPVANVVPCTD